MRLVPYLLAGPDELVRAGGAVGRGAGPLVEFQRVVLQDPGPVDVARARDLVDEQVEFPLGKQAVAALVLQGPVQLAGDLVQLRVRPGPVVLRLRDPVGVLAHLSLLQLRLLHLLECHGAVGQDLVQPPGARRGAGRVRLPVGGRNGAPRRVGPPYPGEEGQLPPQLPGVPCEGVIRTRVGQVRRLGARRLPHPMGQDVDGVLVGVGVLRARVRETRPGVVPGQELPRPLPEHGLLLLAQGMRRHTGPHHLGRPGGGSDGGQGLPGPRDRGTVLRNDGATRRRTGLGAVPFEPLPRGVPAGAAVTARLWCRPGPEHLLRAGGFPELVAQQVRERSGRRVSVLAKFVGDEMHHRVQHLVVVVGRLRVRPRIEGREDGDVRDDPPSTAEEERAVALVPGQQPLLRLGRLLPPVPTLPGRFRTRRGRQTGPGSLMLLDTEVVRRVGRTGLLALPVARGILRRPGRLERIAPRTGRSLALATLPRVRLGQGTAVRALVRRTEPCGVVGGPAGRGEAPRTGDLRRTVGVRFRGPRGPRFLGLGGFRRLPRLQAGQGAGGAVGALARRGRECAVGAAAGQPGLPGGIELDAELGGEPAAEGFGVASQRMAVGQPTRLRCRDPQFQRTVGEDEGGFLVPGRVGVARFTDDGRPGGVPGQKVTHRAPQRGRTHVRRCRLAGTPDGLAPVGVGQIGTGRAGGRYRVGRPASGGRPGPGLGVRAHRSVGRRADGGGCSRTLCSGRGRDSGVEARQRGRTGFGADAGVRVAARPGRGVGSGVPAGRRGGARAGFGDRPGRGCPGVRQRAADGTGRRTGGGVGRLRGGACARVGGKSPAQFLVHRGAPLVPGGEPVVQRAGTAGTVLGADECGVEEFPGGLGMVVDDPRGRRRGQTRRTGQSTRAVPRRVLSVIPGHRQSQMALGTLRRQRLPDDVRRRHLLGAATADRDACQVPQQGVGRRAGGRLQRLRGPLVDAPAHFQAQAEHRALPDIGRNRGGFRRGGVRQAEGTRELRAQTRHGLLPGAPRHGPLHLAQRVVDRQLLRRLRHHVHREPRHLPAHLRLPGPQRVTGRLAVAAERARLTEHGAVRRDQLLTERPTQHRVSERRQLPGRRAVRSVAVGALTGRDRRRHRLVEGAQCALDPPVALRGGGEHRVEAGALVFPSQPHQLQHPIGGRAQVPAVRRLDVVAGAQPFLDRLRDVPVHPHGRAVVEPGCRG
ncbi:hypothetical protein SCANM63S_05948 [Streptomyces canarius]